MGRASPGERVIRTGSANARPLFAPLFPQSLFSIPSSINEASRHEAGTKRFRTTSLRWAPQGDKSSATSSCCAYFLLALGALAALVAFTTLAAAAFLAVRLRVAFLAAFLAPTRLAVAFFAPT